jgi:hypothetical protein
MSLFGKPGDLNRQFIARPDEAKERHPLQVAGPDHPQADPGHGAAGRDRALHQGRQGCRRRCPQGRSTLDGALIPFLGDIVDWASGGNMYRCELYFVGTREFVSLPFGGPVDNIEDPETGSRWACAYSASTRSPSATRRADPETGRHAPGLQRPDHGLGARTDPQGAAHQRRAQADRGEMAGAGTRRPHGEIEASLLADVQEPLGAYGLKITRLGNVTISLKPEDEQTLKGLRKDTAYTRLAGGFREYGVGAALKGIGEGARRAAAAARRRSASAWDLGGMVAGVGLAAPLAAAAGGAPGAAAAAPVNAPARTATRRMRRARSSVRAAAPRWRPRRRCTARSAEPRLRRMRASAPAAGQR